jgi:hypothetical protein
MDKRIIACIGYQIIEKTVWSCFSRLAL